MAARSSTLEAAIALFVACAVGCGVFVALTWPMAQAPGSTHVVGSFHLGHTWGFDHIARLVSGEHAWGTATSRIGYPERFQMPLVAWGPAVFAMPIRAIAGPVVAYNLALLLAPALTVLGAAALVRRVTGAAWETAAAAGLTVALCPFALGALACGQTAKLHLWVLCLPLLALSWAARGPHRWAGLLALVPASVLAVFTAPSVVVYAPLAAGVLVLWELATGRKAWLRTTLGSVAGLGVMAAVFVAGAGYYQPAEGGLPSAVRPASLINQPKNPFEVPAAFSQPEQLLWGDLPLTTSPWHTNHVGYLGGLLLVALVLALVLRSRGSVLALGITLVGGLLALGPSLASGDVYLQLLGVPVPLPAQWLSDIGFPAATSGTWYRAVAVGSVGLAIGLGALGARLRGWKGVVLVWVLAGLHVADAWRVTQPLWPRPIEPVSGYSTLERWGATPGDGAVLDLPLDTSLIGAHQHLIAAVLHGRPTTSVSRMAHRQRVPHLFELKDMLDTLVVAKDPVAARASLVALGFDYAVYRPAAERPNRRNRVRARIRELESALGPARMDGKLATWELNP